MRLFVAVNLPATEKQRLARVLAELRALALPVRWVDPEASHITLKFLGEVAEQRVREITTALERAVQGIPPFDVALGGFGAFPTPTRPRLFWLGVTAPPALSELQQQVANELAALGYAREEREFRAHLTLGRVKESVRLERNAFGRLAPNAEFEAEVTVDSVDLMRSQLGQGGARYELLERALLRPDR